MVSAELFVPLFPTARLNWCCDYRACYISVVLYIAGFVVLGACMEQLNIAGLVLGWGIAQCVVVFNTVAVCECECDLHLTIPECSIRCRRIL